ncbi:MAG: lysophospholipid acyltransferase family protein [Elusimicrobia bacterium]|nr:lysophospholipid acyltransferase family protein [Elusimicrobiota bacterium]
MSILRRLAPYLAYLYVSFVGLTSRLRWLGLERLAEARRVKGRADGPVVYAFWHQRQVFFTWTHRGAHCKILVSRSADGEIIAQAMRLSRIHSCRGSSSRGAVAAARELLEALEQGWDVAVTCDGPKGPARQVKDGILYLAQKTGRPIVPIANALSRRIEIARAWDRFQVPLPFSRAAVVHGRLVHVGPQDDLAAKARELKAALDEAHELAERETAR